MQQRCRDFTLSDIDDGYVYLRPMDAWHSVTFRPDFITPANYTRVEARWRAEKPRRTPYPIDELRVDGAAALKNQFVYQQGRDR